MTLPLPPDPITFVVAAATGLGYGRGVLRGVYRYAKLRPNCRVLLMPPDSLPELARWNPFGFIVQADNLDLARQLAQLPAAIINIADNHSDLPLPTIISDNVAIGACVADHFIARGFKRLAFFGPTDWYSHLRAHGFHARLQQLQPPRPSTSPTKSPSSATG